MRWLATLVLSSLLFAPFLTLLDGGSVATAEVAPGTEATWGGIIRGEDIPRGVDWIAINLTTSVSAYAEVVSYSDAAALKEPPFRSQCSFIQLNGHAVFSTMEFGSYAMTSSFGDVGGVGAGPFHQTVQGYSRINLPADERPHTLVVGVQHLDLDEVRRNFEVRLPASAEEWSIVASGPLLCGSTLEEFSGTRLQGPTGAIGFDLDFRFHVNESLNGVWFSWSDASAEFTLQGPHGTTSRQGGPLEPNTERSTFVSAIGPGQWSLQGKIVGVRDYRIGWVFADLPGWLTAMVGAEPHRRE